MERLRESTIMAVRQAPYWVGVLQSYITLKKRGRNWIGLCPFHSEKSPSFTVNEEKRLWHCFGCQQSGDVIGFVQKIESVGFVDAVQLIAARLNIPIEFEEVSPQQMAQASELDRLRPVMGMMRDFYISQLERYPKVLEYIKERGIADAIRHQFGLGYCPPDGGMGVLKQNGVGEDLIRQAGLGASHYDRFNHRLMFPITDEKGRTIAFGGRALGSDQTPKYMNSDESALFAKRRTLFGLDHAKTSIRKDGVSILVEGYMDVLSMHQAGFTNTVAALGTAFTAEHARILHRLGNRLILALDTDQAGITAMVKAYELASKAGLFVRIARYPGKDPADALAENRLEFEQALQNPVSMLAFQCEQVAMNPPTHLDEAIAIIDRLRTYFNQEEDPVVHRHFARVLARQLKIEPDDIMAKLTTTMPIVKRAYQAIKPSKSPVQQAEEQLLVAMAMNVQDRIRIMSNHGLDLLLTPLYRELAVAMLDFALVDHDLVAAIPNDQHRSLLTALLVDAPSILHTQDALLFLQRHRDEQQLKACHAKLAALESSPHSMESDIQAVLTDIMSITQRLRGE